MDTNQKKHITIYNDHTTLFGVILPDFLFIISGVKLKLNSSICIILLENITHQIIVIDVLLCVYQLFEVVFLAIFNAELSTSQSPI